MDKDYPLLLDVVKPDFEFSEEQNSPEVQFNMTKLAFGTYFAVVAIATNGFLLFVIARQTQLHSTLNFLIANWAAADILASTFALFYDWSAETNSALLGEAICSVLLMSQSVCIYVSALSGSAIAIEFFLTKRNPAHQTSRKIVALLVSCLWLFALLATLPHGMNSASAAFNSISGQPMKVCLENWSDQRSRLLFKIITKVLQFGIPSGIILFCFAAIFRRNRGASQQPAMLEGTQRLFEKEKYLLAICLSFAIRWLPFDVRDAVQEYLSFTSLTWLSYFAVFCTYTSVLNPVLFGFYDDKFSEAALTYFVFNKRRRLPVA